MKVLVVLPIAVPLVAAALALIFRGRRTQAALAVTGAAVLLAGGIALFWAVWTRGTLVVQLGGWEAPFGISLVADTLAAAMVLVTGVIGACIAVYSLEAVDAVRQRHGFFPLVQILLMGVCGAFLTGDLFNLYVWFEVMLIASFVLLSLGGERAQLEGALKYVTLNLVSSALFLAAVGLLYGMTGTLNLADLAERLRESTRPGLISAVALLLLAAFGIKAAAFPLFFWLPASYHTPPIAVSALFAALLTKVGVYALFRTFTLLFVRDVGLTHELILIVAGLTMLTGVLGAAAQMDFRRVLSFHIISQIGYMLMGLGLFSAAALSGGVFYVVHHIIVKTNLFLIAGLVAHAQGTYDLRKLGGVWAQRPWLALLFLVPAFALAGMPPLSGFFAKLSLLRAGLEVERYGIVAVAAIVSVLTLFSMTKVWAEVFWKDAPVGEAAAHPAGERRLPWRMVIPSCALAAVTVALGLGAEAGTRFAARAAGELLSATAYIAAVKGGAP